MTDIARRKTDHLDLCANGDVAFRQRTTLFECVQFVHDSVPELSLDDVDPRCTVLGKELSAPILIAGMTGGTDRARTINRTLAEIADRRGYAFGLGSQRPMLDDAALTATYAVRDVAPRVLLLGNVGAVQAVRRDDEALAALVERVGADALCVHLNPAMELVQPEGDRDFRGVLPRLAALGRALPVPIVAKETGCGLSRSAVERLRAHGVAHVDVSGAGGTSWVGVETLRTPAHERGPGETFWDWGIPTAASVMAAAAAGASTIFATGGLGSGLDVARAIALGATVGGLARPVLQAYESGGAEGAEGFLARVERELRMAMLLVGARTIEDLRAADPLVGGELRTWRERWSRAR